MTDSKSNPFGEDQTDTALPTASPFQAEREVIGEFEAIGWIVWMMHPEDYERLLAHATDELARWNIRITRGTIR